MRLKLPIEKILSVKAMRALIKHIKEHIKLLKNADFKNKAKIRRAK